MKYSLDTNVISDFMRNDENVVRNMNRALANGDEIYICSVVYYEIVRGLTSAGKFKRLKEFHIFYENYGKLYFDRKNLGVVDKAVEIYVQLHKGKQIEDNDIFIAATAILNDCTLVTANVKHFERVAELKLINWREN